MPIHRTIKNVVHNYTYAEVKVREATSNDPWGPSTSLMSEIAQLTNNPLAYNEVMAMIWRRMNDHGKNWRHVYKSLMLLEYLMKHGSERVARECRANIVAIRTLADFQHVDENGRDNGLSVREKARQMAILLGDDERLRNERIRAHESHERFGGSNSRDGRESPTVNVTRLDKYPASSSHLQATEASRRPSGNTEIDSVRPATTGEEELQLQLALALSKEEHEEEMKRQKADDLKLQMAIEESKKTAFPGGNDSSRKQKSTSRSSGNAASAASTLKANPPTASLLDGPLDSVLQDPWATTPAYPSQPVKSSTPQRDPWAELIDTQTAPRGPSSNDLWSSLRSSSPVAVMYADVQRGVPSTLAPWEEVEAKIAASNPPAPTKRGPPMYDPEAEFSALSVRPKNDTRNGYEASSDLLDMSSDPYGAPQSSSDLLRPVPATAKKLTPEEFLGANAKLVDFDDLVAKPTPQSNINPFAMTVGKQSVVNPFVTRAKEEEQSKRVPINQLSAGGGGGQMPMAQSTVYPSMSLVYSSQPVPPQHGYNPFL